MKRPSTRTLIAFFIVAVLASYAGYKLKFAPMPVVSHTVVRGEIVAEVMGTGTLEARVTTTISARIQERLSEVLVDQGDTVKAGQLLARLDDTESKQQVAIADATLAAAKQTADRVRADLARSEAVLAQAQVVHSRLATLQATNAVSQLELEKATESLRISEADLKRSHATIAEAEGQIAVAEKTLLIRKNQLAFTEILSPYDGLIIRRDRDVGDVLVPGASLMQIISLDELWISAWVDETGIRALAADQRSRLVFRSEPSRSYAGSVSRLGREMDRETREFLVDVRASDLPRNWTIGQRAEVFIETGRQADAVLIPTAYLGWNAERAGVFVNAEGKAKWQEVTTGLHGRDQTAITNGLNVGDQVVRIPDGDKAVLTDGQRIALP